ncbi:hypothetical protein PUR71_00380, partial [Streptomyces sp. SP17BM10]|nr:hypothetical protein [Streptomyces sp. SP17BM10]
MRRRSTHARFAVDTTHPPTHLRIALLDKAPALPAAVTIAALAFVGSLLVAWLVQTAPTFPVPPPYTPPAATHTPLPLPTGQPLASLLASANLGPGFDAFGLALGLYDDVVVRVADSGLSVDIAGEGA